MNHLSRLVTLCFPKTEYSSGCVFPCPQVSCYNFSQGGVNVLETCLHSRSHPFGIGRVGMVHRDPRGGRSDMPPGMGCTDRELGVSAASSASTPAAHVDAAFLGAFSQGGVVGRSPGGLVGVSSFGAGLSLVPGDRLEACRRRRQLPPVPGPRGRRRSRLVPRISASWGVGRPTAGWRLADLDDRRCRRP